RRKLGVDAGCGSEIAGVLVGDALEQRSVEVLVTVAPGDSEPDTRDGRLIGADTAGQMGDADELLAARRNQLGEALRGSYPLVRLVARAERLQIPVVGQACAARVALEVPVPLDGRREADEDPSLEIRGEVAA